jgi:hypothetical protein
MCWPPIRLPRRARSSMRWRNPSPARAACSRQYRPVEVHRLSGMRRCLRPEGAVPHEQDAALLSTLQRRFDFMSKTPNTPARFVDDAIEPGGEIKRLLLDRSNYYSTTGGHGGCRGCGEVTAIRLVMATNHAITDKRRHEHIAELEATDRRPRRQAGDARQEGSGAQPAHWRAHRHAGKAPLPLRERPDRQRPGRRGDRQLDRLQQRLCLDLPVQRLQRSVGEQPVPGRAAAGQGHLRRHLGADRRRRARAARGPPRTGGCLRSREHEPGAAHARVEGFHGKRNSRSCRP